MEWSRLHPLTPLLRGGRYVLVIIAVIGQQGLRETEPWLLLLVFGVGTPLAVLVGFVSWRTTRYRVEGIELHLTNGVLQKRDRRVPLPRVQSIDLVRPLLARIFGLAELRLEVVGSGDSEARLSYLTEHEAKRLRASLLSLAAGREQEAEPTEHALVNVPTGALVGSVLLGAPLVTGVAFAVVLVVTAAVDPASVAGVLVAAVSVLLGVAGVAVRRVLAEYGFSVTEVPDGLRLRHGLLDRRTQTIPTGRVQTVRIREPLLWRHAGWVRVEVDVAGYGATRGEEQAATSALLPVAPREFALALVARVLGADPPIAGLGVPAVVRWRAPLSRRRLRIGSDLRHVVGCSGIVTTTTDIVPLAKVQSLRLTAGPWQRRLGLASLHVDSAGRRLPGAVLSHRSAREAEELLAVLTTRSRAAR